MKSLLSNLILSAMVFSATALAGGEGNGHTHGAGGETEHLYPVLMVLALLVLAGAAFHFASKKK